VSQHPEVITFCGLPQPEEATARAAVIPAPLEATVSYGRGAALGPLALMIASGQVELYDELVGAEPTAWGVLTRPRAPMGGPVEEALDRIRAAVAAELAAGRLPALVGGEHTVTLGALAALVEARGPDFTVLCLDAHLDLRESYEGERLSHATVMRRALDMGLMVRQVGVRAASAEEMELLASRPELRPVWARDIHRDPSWPEAALEGLEGPVYLSLDVDGLDPGIMPGTGTPEPGGLSWDQAGRWLAAVCAAHPVVGLDLVELAPLPGQSLSDFTAARLLHRALGLALARRGAEKESP
jgi:agmatinase